MNLSSDLKKRYCSDNSLSSREAQRMAEFIAWGPVLFQATRLMVKFGILDLIRDSENGLTQKEIVDKTSLSQYAVKCLMEASLSIGTVLIDTDTERYTISKIGWFVLNDPATRVNMNFNHDVNYLGMFNLEEALLKGTPEGLKFLGEWPTIYQGLSSLSPAAKESWFAFDHFYSDSSFPEALKILFDTHKVKTLYDIGGNTGKWALQCVEYSPDAQVTIFDLPGQIKMMQKNIEGKKGAERISGKEIDMLDPSSVIPKKEGGVDAIWMSQFLDCFSMPQIVNILRKIKDVMDSNSRIFIMETLWAMANGNSKMYNTEDLTSCIHEAGFEIEKIYDNLGQAHSVVCVKKRD